MIFTKTDKALMMRAARQIAELAAVAKMRYGGNWAESKESREAKRMHDRLLRDERDLRELAKRQEKAASAAEAEAATKIAPPLRAIDNG